jgi:hypothetical protein
MTHAKADAPHPCVSCGRPTIVLTRSASGEEYAECMDCWVRATRDASLHQPATPAPQVTSGGLVLVADVGREQVTWLWPDRIPAAR